MSTKKKPGVFDYGISFQSKLVRVLYDDVDFTTTCGVHLKTDAFEKRIHRWFADKIIEYAKKHGHGVSIDALRIGLKRDAKIGKFPKDNLEAAHAMLEKLERPLKERSFIKEELFKFIKHQAIRSAILNAAQAGGHLDHGDYDAIDEDFARVTEIQESLTGGLGTFFVRDVKARTTKRKKYTKDGISTGTKADDYLKPGGVPRKNLAVIVAPSGKGKSHNLVHIGKSAIVESNVKVLHVTLELSEDAILDRYDATFSDIPAQRLEEKPIAVKRAIKQLGEQYGEFLVVKEFPSATLTVPALRAYIRQLERIAFYPDVVIVDYADEMLPSWTSKNDDPYEAMGRIYRELRKMAHELQVVVWTASQTNKTALNKEFFDWNDIADSSKKVMIADYVVCFLQTLAEKKKKEARWMVAKSRLGPDKFDIKLRVDWSRSQIRSV